MAQAWQEHLNSLNVASAEFLSENTTLKEEVLELKKEGEGWRKEKLDLVKTQGELLDKVDVQAQELEELKAGLEQARKDGLKWAAELEQVKKENSDLRMELKREVEGREEMAKKMWNLRQAFENWFRETEAARKSFQVVFNGIIPGLAAGDEEIGGGGDGEVVGNGVELAPPQRDLNMMEMEMQVKSEPGLGGKEDGGAGEDEVDTSDDSTDGDDTFLQDEEDMDDDDSLDSIAGYTDAEDGKGDSGKIEEIGGGGVTAKNEEISMPGLVLVSAHVSSPGGGQSEADTLLMDSIVEETPQQLSQLRERIFGTQVSISIAGTGEGADAKLGELEEEKGFGFGTPGRQLRSSSVDPSVTPRKRYGGVDSFWQMGNTKRSLDEMEMEEEDSKTNGMEVQSDDGGTKPKVGGRGGTWRGRKY